MHHFLLCILGCEWFKMIVCKNVHAFCMHNFESLSSVSLMSTDKSYSGRPIVFLMNLQVFYY